MIYKQQEPTRALSEIIKSFWMIDGEADATIREEKIIPDGYPEMIFHYGDPFRSKISEAWLLQEKDLIAGQISNFFFLENTGTVGMFALKFQPWALRKLFDIKIANYTDKVLPIHSEVSPIINGIKNVAISSLSFEEKVAGVEKLLSASSKPTSPETKGEQATKFIIQHNGGITLQAVQENIGISERSLERYFKEYIGLSPKFYCRIIRFSYIFNLVNQGTINWSDVSFHSGFYDQSHFIKNFKEFTGEEPSKYGFTKETMANFLLS
jgi:AraC-like DNA-binding protein